jgi:aspartyl protease family protein
VQRRVVGLALAQGLATGLAGPLALTALTALASLTALPATAQSVQMAGQMGRKALLVIDGQTVTLGLGETRSGVTLRALNGDTAELEYGGQRHSLTVGGAPARVAGDGAAAANGRSIVLSAGSGGHFMTDGAINGRVVRFMVDTGATTIALSAAEAQRIGLDYQDGQRALMQTAGGTVAGHVLTLSAVTVGAVTLANVSAVVIPAPMPFVLLGNSFLSRFQMRRENDVMRLDLR